MQVGQPIIYKGDMANQSGYGFCVAIRENQTAGKMYSMDWKAGKLVQFDSSKSYDFVLEDGRRMNGIYESNIGGEAGDRSCRFMLGDGLPIDAGGVAVLLQRAEAIEADRKAQAIAAAAEAEKAAAEACAGKSVKFMKYYVTDGTLKAKVWYSLDNRTDGRKCVTLYARDYDRTLGQILSACYKNDTDTMTDYFDKGKATIYESNPLYAAARARAEQKAAA